MTQSPIRVLCCREIQRSIKQSVHRLIKDTIYRNGLESFFTITDSSIKSMAGAEVIFEGLWQNEGSIKSLEGIDICWVEEAQTMRKYSLHILTPTIRKEASEIWFTYNPTDDNDAIVELENTMGALGIVLEQNFGDNPFLPDVLREEQEHMKSTDYELWRHVWNGETLKRSDAEIFSGKWRTDYFEAPQGVTFYHGVDWGGSKTDPTVLVRCYIQGNTLYIDHAHYFYETDLQKFIDWFPAAVPTSKNWRIYADSAGATEIRYFYGRGFQMFSVGKKTTIESGIRYLRSFDEIVIHEDLKSLILEAKMYKYKVDPKTEQVTPIIEDKHNHGWDAIRYALHSLIIRGKK